MDLSNEKFGSTTMNKLNTNVTIFILFFGLALVEALKQQDWLESILFLALGAIFLWADRKETT